MDLIKKRIGIARIIVEELTETIDEKARIELTRWLEEDERHRMEYERVRESLQTGSEAWKDQERGRQVMEVRWSVVKSRTVQKKVRWITWCKYAAVVLLFLGIGTFWLVNEERRETQLVTVAKIEHGSTKAQLILADGKKVELGTAINLQLEEVGGLQILTSDNMIKYIGKDSSIQQVTEMKYNTLSVPRGGEYSLELADGTRVWLNAESRLRYPVAFVGKERKVELEGEGYFEVAKNKEKPFIATVNGVDVRVLGTSFNVSAYRNEVITTLVEGKVQLKKGEDSVVLQPNQQGIWLSENRGFEVKEVEARNFSLWREGIFYFDDVDLETILDDMARWYNVNIFYRNSTLKTKRFSVEIKRYENINEILRRIEQTKRVKFEIKDRTINVYE